MEHIHPDGTDPTRWKISTLPEPIHPLGMFPSWFQSSIISPKRVKFPQTQYPHLPGPPEWKVRLCWDRGVPQQPAAYWAPCLTAFALPQESPFLSPGAQLKIGLLPRCHCRTSGVRQDSRCSLTHEPVIQFLENRGIFVWTQVFKFLFGEALLISSQLLFSSTGNWLYNTRKLFLQCLFS